MIEIRPDLLDFICPRGWLKTEFLISYAPWGILVGRGGWGYLKRFIAIFTSIFDNIENIRKHKTTRNQFVPGVNLYMMTFLDLQKWDSPLSMWMFVNINLFELKHLLQRQISTVPPRSKILSFYPQNNWPRLSHLDNSLIQQEKYQIVSWFLHHLSRLMTEHITFLST